jgi:hypothetical protein
LLTPPAPAPVPLALSSPELVSCSAFMFNASLNRRFLASTAHWASQGTR